MKSNFLLKTKKEVSIHYPNVISSIYLIYSKQIYISKNTTHQVGFPTNGWSSYHHTNMISMIQTTQIDSIKRRNILWSPYTSNHLDQKTPSNCKKQCL